MYIAQYYLGSAYNYLFPVAIIIITMAIFVFSKSISTKAAISIKRTLHLNAYWIISIFVCSRIWKGAIIWLYSDSIDSDFLVFFISLLFATIAWGSYTMRQPFAKLNSMRRLNGFRLEGGFKALFPRRFVLVDTSPKKYYIQIGDISDRYWSMNCNITYSPKGLAYIIRQMFDRPLSKDWIKLDWIPGNDEVDKGVDVLHVVNETLELYRDKFAALDKLGPKEQKYLPHQVITELNARFYEKFGIIGFVENVDLYPTFNAKLEQVFKRKFTLSTANLSFQS